MSRRLIKVAMNLVVAAPVAAAVLVPPNAAGAAGSFDGTYRGTYTTIRTNGSAECASLDSSNVTLVITDNHFTRKWGPAVLSVDVAANGSFSTSVSVTQGQRPRVTAINGTVAGGVLDAELGNNLCAVHVALKKS